MPATLLLALLLTVITFFSTAAGGLIAIKYRRDLVAFLAFAAGALIGVSFFDVLPSSFLIVGNLQYLDYITISVVLGFLYYHVTQRTIAIHSHTRSIHGQDNKGVGYVGAGGLTVHSFFDGFGIGASLQVGLAVGSLFALGVVMHDFSDGLNTVTLMLRSGNRLRSTFAFLLADASSPILGAAAGSTLNVSSPFLAYILAFFAGEFISIGASDLLPEADSKETSWRIIGLTVLGVAFVFVLSRLA